MLLCSWLSITAVDKVMGACVLEVSEEAIMIYDLFGFLCVRGLWLRGDGISRVNWILGVSNNVRLSQR